jgi:hypothetical protein
MIGLIVGCNMKYMLFPVLFCFRVMQRPTIDKGRLVAWMDAGGAAASRRHGGLNHFNLKFLYKIRKPSRA